MSLTLFILLGFSFFSKQITNMKQEKIVVYKVKDATAVDFVSGKQNVLFTDTSLLQHGRTIEYSIQGNWTRNGIHQNLHLPFTVERYTNDDLCKINNFILFKNRVITRIHTNDILLGPAKIKVDYVIISGKPDVTMKEVNENFECQEIILDSSIPFWKAKQYKEECREIGLLYYDVNEDGAWIKNL